MLVGVRYVRFALSLDFLASLRAGLDDSIFNYCFRDMIK